jgi:endonuclease/exonuclease/phosphatase family metal-dependent hydrolase
LSPKNISLSELREMVKVRQSRKLSFFNRLLLWLNYLFILALLISLSAKYISPQSFWLIAFFGLGFPYIVLANLLFSIYWLIQFRRVALLSIFAILFSFFTMRNYFQFSFDSKDSSGDIKVTSFNSMLFDLYNWSKNAQSRQHILSSLHEINPDVLCLQEFYNSEEEGDFHNIDTILNSFTTKYYHAEYTATRRNTDHWGIATFSKYPIINKGKILFNSRSNNLCIYSDVLINADTVRIYNMHLQSISFSKQDYKFIDEIQSDKDVEDELESSKSILRRLKRAFVKRSEQAEKVAASISSCPYKIILCGDFNDTPASYAYHLLTENLNDAFIEKGSGFGRTYAGKFPQFRIDYILHSKEIKCKRFTRSDETYTDHFPITASFSLEE